MLFPYLWLRSTGFPFAWVEELALPGLFDPSAPEYADHAAFQAHLRRSRRRLGELMTRQDIQEALLLSNMAAVDRLAALAAADLDHPNVRTRQRLRLAWSYLQRFCTKNETVSFFGPLAWGTVDPDAPQAMELVECAPGAGWLRRRRVAVEYWVVHRLCEHLGRTHPGFLPYHLHAGCDLDGEGLRVPLGRRVRIDSQARRFLAAPADTTIRPPPALVTTGVVRRSPRIPAETADPLRELETAVGGPLTATARLAALRGQFENAGYDHRRALLAEMTAVLVEAGIDPTRPTGTPYAGRLPVYEDCERNLRLRVGGRLADLLATRLPRALRPYRVVAQCVAGELSSGYAAVADGRTDFMTVLHALRSAPGDRVRRDIETRTRAALAAAWAPHLGTTDACWVDDAALDAVCAALGRAFPAHERFGDVLGVGLVSPDVLIAATEPAAMDGARVTVVLGEVHPAVFAALQPVALPFLDEREEALALADRALGGDRMVLAGSDAAYQRSQLSWPATAHLYEVVIPGATARCPVERQIPAGRCRVVDRDGIPYVVDRVTHRADQLVSVLSSDLQRILFGLAGEVLGGGSDARLWYRDVLLRRRRWRLPTDQIGAAGRPAEEPADYHRLRDWAMSQGLPRRGFVRAGPGTKPVYLDWANPIAVDGFARLARRTPSVTVTEMVPGPGELWLADHSGAHTAELRMTYVI